MNANDFLKTLDLTAVDDATGSQVNQNFETGTPSSDRGLVLVTTDSAADTPVVPDPSVYTRFTRYVWLRKLYAEANLPKLYAWQEGATSDPTYLKWVQISLAEAELETFLNTFIPAYFADNPIDGADIDANTIPLSALAQQSAGVVCQPVAGTGNVTVVSSISDDFVFQRSSGGYSFTTVKTNGIATQAITADHLSPGSVTNNAITDNLISGAKLTFASLPKNKLAATDPDISGTFGSAAAIPAVTVDTYGFITGITTVSALVQATFVSAETAIPAAAADVTIAHGLSGRPNYWNITLIVDDAGGDIGYADNEEVDWQGFIDSTAFTAFSVQVTASAFVFSRAASTTTIYGVQKSTKVLTAIDTAKWKIKISAAR